MPAKPLTPAQVLRKAQAAANSRKLQEPMALALKAHGLDAGMQREFRFHPVRMWRFDFAWPDRKLALEVEGAIWSGGKHGRGAGIKADMEKQNAATAQGWRLLRVCVNHIQSGEAVQFVKESMS